MKLILKAILAMALAGGFVQPVAAQDFGLVPFAPPEGKGKPAQDEPPADEEEPTGYVPPSVDVANYQAWMDPDIELVWPTYLGAGASITVVDDFTSKSKLRADLGLGRARLRHGEWTHLQASMIAPGADMYWDDFNDGAAVALQSGFNILNLSYGWIGRVGNATDENDFSNAHQEQSILSAALNDDALISKSAGNDGDLFSGAKYAVGQPVGTSLDYLGTGLVGVIKDYQNDTNGAANGFLYQETDGGGNVTYSYEFAPIIFAGSLDEVGYSIAGSDDGTGTLSYYSNIAGTDVDVQNHFVVVGVDYGITDLAGTSFAAPVISGYAALVAQKFVLDGGGLPDPSKVAAQLLTTAREDTINGYNPTLHGQGEACIACAVGITSMR